MSIIQRQHSVMLLLLLLPASTNEVYLCAYVHVCSDVNQIREGIGDKVANALQWLATFISGLALGIAYGWKLALVIIAVSPLLVICGGMMTYVSNFWRFLLLSFSFKIISKVILIHYDMLLPVIYCYQCHQRIQ